MTTTAEACHVLPVSDAAYGDLLRLINLGLRDSEVLDRAGVGMTPETRAEIEGMLASQVERYRMFFGEHPWMDAEWEATLDPRNRSWVPPV